MKYLKYLLFISLISVIFLQDHNHDHDGHQHHDHGVIRGSIIDEITEGSKRYANISIVDGGSDDIIDGGISDEEGMFLIDMLPFGRYYLVVEYIGYEDKIIDEIAIYPPNNLIIDLGPIQISPKMILIDGVSVVEKAPIIEDIEKTTYPVAETARASGGSADEVLEQLPSISIDGDGNLALRGNSNVTVLIDGRKSQISVDMLNASMIEKVEVMTTPSAKYDPDGIAGIINIVLSDNQFVGNSGNINFNIEERDGKNVSGTFNSFQNNWNIFTSYSLNYKNKQGRVNREITNYDIDDNTIIEKIKATERSERHPEKKNFKIGIENYPNEKSTIAFDLTFLQHEGTDTTDVLTTIGSGSPVNSQIIDNGRRGKGKDLNYGLGYFADDKESKRNFSIEFDYDDHDDIEIVKKDGNLIEEIEDNGITKIFSMDYAAPLANSFNEDAKYELGLKATTEDDFHGGDMYGEDFIWNYDNDIAALYFNTSYNFTENFGMQFGTRFEKQEKVSIISDYTTSVNYIAAADCESLNQSDCESNGYCEWDVSCQESIFYDVLSNSTDKLNNIYDHNRAFPSLYFLYSLPSGGNLKLEMGRRINRPSHHHLNPIPNLEAVASKFINQGNPALIPEDIYKTEFSYSGRLPIGFLKTAIYYTKIDDKLDRDRDVYNDDYSILTWKNVAKSTGTGMELTFMTQPLPNWDIMFNGFYWDNELDGAELDQIGKEYGFWGMINSTVRLQNKQEIGLYAHHSTPMTLVTGEIESFRRMDLTYKKKVSDKFNFTIKLKDVFDTSGFGITTNQLIDSNGADDIDFDQREILIADSRRNKRAVSINFEYRFGAFQKKKYRREGGHGHSHGDEGMEQGF